MIATQENGVRAASSPVVPSIAAEPMLVQPLTELGDLAGVDIATPPGQASAAPEHVQSSCTTTTVRSVQHYECIEPARGWQPVNFRELWAYRDLISLLAMRDIKAHYRRTRLGIAWVVLQPLALMVVFSTFFSLLGTKPAAGDVPYALSLLCALVPWQFFASVLNQSADSLVNNQHLIGKIYCPRLIFPLVPVLSTGVDFAVGLGLLLIMLAAFAVTPTWAILALPLFVLLAVITALAGGIWLAALTVRYRDLRFMLPVVLQIGFYVSPIIYEMTKLIPPRWIPLYSLNPLAGVAEGFRWSLIGGTGVPLATFAISTCAVLALFISGLFYFRRVERTLADNI